MDNRITQLVDTIGKENVLQEKYLKGVIHELEKNEIDELSRYLDFMGGVETYNVFQIAQAYLLFVEDTLRETKYFVENNSSCYRYSTYEEVADMVYNDEDYMSKYMIGLQLSGYIWVNHLKIHRYFMDFLNRHHGNNYLEVGPGHGRHFLEAINIANYKKYLAVDVSETSLKLTQNYVEKNIENTMADVEFFRGDFLSLNSRYMYDAVVISEVLEHVEKPLEFIKKAYSLMSDEGVLYINVPINAPAIDHIWLFHSVEEVEKMVDEANFRIVDKYVVTGNNIPLERAVRKKMAINLVLVLKKS